MSDYTLADIPLEVAEFFTLVFDPATTFSFSLVCKRLNTFMSYSVSKRFFLSLGNKRERYIDAVEKGYTSIANELLCLGSLSPKRASFLCDIAHGKLSMIRCIHKNQGNITLSKTALRDISSHCSLDDMIWLLSLFLP